MAADDQTAGEGSESGDRKSAAASSTRPGKSRTAFRTISEVADELDVAQHVLRFWESKFSQVRPLKRGGGRRYYRPEDVELLREIRVMLYDQGYTIKGAQKLIRTKRSKPKTRQQSLDLAETPSNEPAAPVSALHELRSHLVAMRDRATATFGS